MSTNTIILLILGLIVLVILVLGFTLGWNRFLPFIDTNNVKNVAAACSTACSTQGTFDFCQSPRDVNNGTAKFTDTCNNLANDAKYASNNYGIEKCPAIDCATPAA